MHFLNHRILSTGEGLTNHVHRIKKKPEDALLVWCGLLIARAMLFLPITIVTGLEMHFVFTSVMFKVKYTDSYIHTQ